MRFRYIDEEGTERFRCQLACVQCLAHKANGGPCTRRVCMGTPVCWQHLRTIKDANNGLKIQPSQVAGAGKGLFAWSRAGGDTIVFRPNETIVPYDGELITREVQTTRYGGETGPYVLEGASQFIFDGACARGVGSFANGSRGQTKANARVSKSHAGGVQRMVMKASKNIRHGQEIIAAYGARYWQTNRGHGLTSR